MAEDAELQRRVDVLEYRLELALNVICGRERRLSRHFLDCEHDQHAWEGFHRLFRDLSHDLPPTTTGEGIIAAFVAGLPGLSGGDVRAMFRELKRDGNQGVLVRVVTG